MIFELLGEIPKIAFLLLLKAVENDFFVPTKSFKDDTISYGNDKNNFPTVSRFVTHFNDLTKESLRDYAGVGIIILTINPIFFKIRENVF